MIDSDQDMTVQVGSVELAGHLTLPQPLRGVVLFAHGSGSSSRSPRNRYVARALNELGLGTLLFDLLTPGEELDRANVFDIELLSERLLGATRWIRESSEANLAPLGYFGASTGAAAALVAAADPVAEVAAVVSRGGRADMAGDRLPAVRAPTLLIVGGDDQVVLELNRQAQAALTCENRLEIVPGATHLFDEAGALETVAALAGEWFSDHLAPGTTRP